MKQLKKILLSSTLFCVVLNANALATNSLTFNNLADYKMSVVPNKTATNMNAAPNQTATIPAKIDAVPSEMYTVPIDGRLHSYIVERHVEGQQHLYYFTETCAPGHYRILQDIDIICNEGASGTPLPIKWWIQVNGVCVYSCDNRSALNTRFKIKWDPSVTRVNVVGIVPDSMEGQRVQFEAEFVHTKQK